MENLFFADHKKPVMAILCKSAVMHAKHVSVSKKWLHHVFRVKTERLHIGAVSAPCKETLAA